MHVWEAFAHQDVGQVAAPRAELPEYLGERAMVGAGSFFTAGAFAVDCGTDVLAVALPFVGAAGKVVADGGLNFRFWIFDLRLGGDLGRHV